MGKITTWGQKVKSWVEEFIMRSQTFSLLFYEILFLIEESFICTKSELDLIFKK